VPHRGDGWNDLSGELTTVLQVAIARFQVLLAGSIDKQGPGYKPPNLLVADSARGVGDN